LFPWHVAAALIDGPWGLAELIARGSECLGERPRWLPGLAERILTEFPDEASRPDVEALAHFIRRDRGFRSATERVFRGSRTMAASLWAVPPLPSPAALAEWLGLTSGELDWFADCQGREAHLPPGPLRHYAYRWVAKRAGRARLIEMPRRRLKAIQ